MDYQQNLSFFPNDIYEFEYQTMQITFDPLIYVSNGKTIAISRHTVSIRKGIIALIVELDPVNDSAFQSAVANG